MKKEESLVGLFSMIIGVFAICSIMNGIGFLLSLVSLALAIPSVLQKKKNKVGAVLGLIFSLIVLFVWLILPRLLILFLICP